MVTTFIFDDNCKPEQLNHCIDSVYGSVRLVPCVSKGTDSWSDRRQSVWSILMFGLVKNILKLTNLSVYV